MPTWCSESESEKRMPPRDALVASYQLRLATSVSDLYDGTLVADYVLAMATKTIKGYLDWPLRFKVSRTGKS